MTYQWSDAVVIGLAIADAALLAWCLPRLGGPRSKHERDLAQQMKGLTLVSYQLTAYLIARLFPRRATVSGAAPSWIGALLGATFAALLVVMLFASPDPAVTIV